MKKAIVLILALINTMFVMAQENNTWRFGVQFGMQGNKAKFVGGMDEANARFHQNPYGSGALNFAMRYDINNHWMIMSGLGFNSVGFEFALAENYSFTKQSERFTMLNSGFSAVEIPALVSYKFNPNCKGWRWILTGGISTLFVGTESHERQKSNSNDGTPAPGNAYLSSTESSNPGAYLQTRFMIGREKLMKRGSIWNFNLVFNAGYSEIARATVNYTVDGKAYSHDFANYGSFVGFRVAYFFKPFGNSHKNKMSSVKESTTPSKN